MRKIIIILLSVIFPCFFAGLNNGFSTINAQTQPTTAQLKIGFFSHDEVLRAMPDYAIANKNLQDLCDQYDKEMSIAEKEFNEKYETFLEEQHTMAKAIREKRQSELQNMMERNVAFKKEAQRLITQAEEDAMKPLHDKIAKAVESIATERAYIMVVNTDSNACPYLNPTMTEDITTSLIDILSK